MIHLWKRATKVYDIRIIWIRGHSKGVGSVLADKHAGEGAELADEASQNRWRPGEKGVLGTPQLFPAALRQPPDNGHEPLPRRLEERQTYTAEGNADVGIGTTVRKEIRNRR